MPSIRPVLMCGGSGTRLWPVSRKDRPKHLIPLVDGRSLLQETALRLKPGSQGPDILAPVVITGAAQADEALEQLGAVGITPVAALIEPEGRNTAAVAAAAVAWSKATGDEALLLLLPSDHQITDLGTFRETLAGKRTHRHIRRIVTFGIAPSRPHTGYGYIRRGEAIGAGFAVAAFKEKPDVQTAAAYLRDGDYSWNAGIFLFDPAVMQRELNHWAADIAAGASRAVEKARRAETVWELDREAFAATPSQPLDIAVMEKTGCAAVVPVDMGWSDVGTWTSFMDVLAKDEGGNVVSGAVHLVDCRNVHARSTGPMTAVVGVENVSVIVTDDAVLVISNDRAEDVKAITSTLAEDGWDHLL